MDCVLLIDCSWSIPSIELRVRAGVLCTRYIIRQIQDHYIQSETINNIPAKRVPQAVVTCVHDSAVDPSDCYWWVSPFE